MTDPSLAPKLRVIGRYSILKELHRGKHSVSYSAVDPVMNRQLVVKAVELLPANPRLSADERKRVEQAFVRQAQAAGRLHHPHIVTVFDAGLSHAFGFLVIERVNGQLLSDLLARGARPAVEHCASLGARIADAVACAHESGVAHGHLGPHNIYILPDGSPKVSGFGGWIDDGASGDEALAGTSRLLPYFQNEVTEQSRAVDLRALAELMFILLSGRPPHPGEVGQALAEGRSPTLDARPDAPRSLCRLVDSWLERNPPSATVLRDALTGFLWDGRDPRVPPSTIGVPLVPPPPPEPVHTTRIIPTDPATGSVTPVGGVGAPAADASPGAGDVPPAPGLAQQWWALAQRRVRQAWDGLRPRLHEHRVPLSAAGVLLGTALLLGAVLAHLHHGAPTAEPVAPGATADATDAGAVDASTTTPAQPAAPARPVRIGLHIRPWGELIVDGRPTGVTPPMQEITVPEGYHVVEVRNGEHPAWVLRFDARAAGPIMIEHDFP